MITRLCYTIILLLLLTSPIAAQDDTAPFPVLDEAAIFADGLTVIERLPVLNFDNEARELYYFNSMIAEWETFDYPQDVDEIFETLPRTDGTYLLRVAGDNFLNWSDVYIADAFIEFNPQENEFYNAESVCEFVRALPYEGLWLLSDHFEDNLYRLCNTETGETTLPLPENLQPILSTVCAGGPPIGGVPLLSENQEWIIFHDCPQLAMDEGYPAYSIYSYELSSNRLNYLGQLEPTQFVMYEGWGSENQIIVLGSELRTYGNRDMYVADFTQENSLELIASTELVQPVFDSSTEHILWVSGDDYNKVMEYDVVSNQISTVMQNLCDVVTYCYQTQVLPSGAKLVALKVEGWGVTTGQVAVLDTETGEVVYQSVYQGLLPITWIDNNTLIFEHYRGQDVSRMELYRVDFDDNIPLETVLNAENDFSDTVDLSSHHLLINKRNDYQTYFLYDILTQRQSLLADVSHNEAIEIIMNWRDTNIIEAVVRYKADICSQMCNLGQWHIRIDALDEERS